MNTLPNFCWKVIQFNSKTLFKDGDPVSSQIIFSGAIQTCEQYNNCLYIYTKQHRFIGQTQATQLTLSYKNISINTYNVLQYNDHTVLQYNDQFIKHRAIFCQQCTICFSLSKSVQAFDKNIKLAISCKSLETDLFIHMEAKYNNYYHKQHFF